MLLYGFTAPFVLTGLDEQLRLLGPLTREERVAVITVLSCIIMLVLQPLHGIDSAWIMLVGFAILVISGVLNRKTISTGIDWTFLLFLGVVFSFAYQSPTYLTAYYSSERKVFSHRQGQKVVLAYGLALLLLVLLCVS